MRMLLWFDVGLVPKARFSDGKSQHVPWKVYSLGLTISGDSAYQCEQTCIETLRSRWALWVLRSSSDSVHTTRCV
jgi:hypothetical protein